jgi:hypothetical protein
MIIHSVQHYTRTMPGDGIKKNYKERYLLAQLISSTILVVIHKIKWAIY